MSQNVNLGLGLGLVLVREQEIQPTKKPPHFLNAAAF
jgi:hypothetical protein